MLDVSCSLLLFVVDIPLVITLILLCFIVLAIYVPIVQPIGHVFSCGCLCVCVACLCSGHELYNFTETYCLEDNECGSAACPLTRGMHYLAHICWKIG